MLNCLCVLTRRREKSRFARLVFREIKIWTRALEDGCTYSASRVN